MTAVGLGLAALGRPAYINLGRGRELGPERDVATMERRTHAMLDAAYRAGVRYVDVARSYGRAEEFLSSWLRLRGIAPGDLTIGSKWGYRYTGEWRVDAPVQEVKDHSLAMFRRQWAETEALLGAHVRLYQVHSATLDSGVLDDDAVLHALAELASRGLVVGLSVSGPRQTEVVRRALEVEVDGVNPFASVQATYNILEPSAAPALAEAHDRGWGVIVKEVLANGRLTRSGLADAAAVEDAAGSGGTGVAVAVEVAADRGEELQELAFTSALDQPWVDVVLSGAVEPTQLDADVACVGRHLEVYDAERLATAAEEPELYWRRRSALPWD